MKFILDEENVRDVISPGGISDQLNVALRAKAYHKSLLKLQILKQTLEADCHTVLDECGFTAALDTLKATPTAVQRRVLGYPSFDYWLDVSWELVRRRSHIRHPELHFAIHLSDLWRYVASAVWLCQGSLSCDMRTNGLGKITFPGAGVYVDDPSWYPHMPLRLHVTSGSVTSGHSGSSEATRHLSVIDIPATSSGIEINSLDYDLRLPGRTTYEYEILDETRCADWIAAIDKSVDTIRAVSHELSDELITSIRTVVPVRSADENVNLSSTFQESPGLVALSYTSDNLILSEALVHEYHHCKLFSLMNIDPLVTSDVADARFYSPWRTDSRPLSGILHGAYVFGAVLEFWNAATNNQIVPTSNALLRRMHLIAGQVTTAVETLKAEGQLTPIGFALVKSLEQNVRKQIPSLPSITQSDHMAVLRIQDKHRATWEQSNSTSIPQARPHHTPVVAGRIDTNRSDELSMVFKQFGTQFATQVANASSSPDYRNDLMLRTIVDLYDLGKIDELRAALDGTTDDSSILLSLVRAHVAYVQCDYQQAARCYTKCLNINRESAYIWECLAFALRHLGSFDDSNFILSHLSELSSSITPPPNVVVKIDSIRSSFTSL